ALVDEAGRPAEGCDFGGNSFLAIGTGSRDLNGTDAAAFQKLGQTAELSCREMLRIDAAFAALVQHRRPLVEGFGYRRADALGMRDAHFELFLSKSPADQGRRDKGGGTGTQNEAPAHSS